MINEEESDDIEEYQYKTTILKIIITIPDIDADIKSKVIKFFLQTYLNYSKENFDIQVLLEDRTLALLLLQVTDKKESKFVKNLCSIHKDIQNMITDNKITIEPEDLKVIIF